MTNKEAHNYLEDLQRKYTRDRHLYKPEFIEANGLAILALEKQIPKKPLSFGNEAYLCPSCKRNNFYEGTEFLHKQKRCLCCGQEIDWSDDE